MTHPPNLLLVQLCFSHQPSYGIDSLDTVVIGSRVFIKCKIVPRFSGLFFFRRQSWCWLCAWWIGCCRYCLLTLIRELVFESNQLIEIFRSFYSFHIISLFFDYIFAAKILFFRINHPKPFLLSPYLGIFPKPSFLGIADKGKRLYLCTRK